MSIDLKSCNPWRAFHDFRFSDQQCAELERILTKRHRKRVAVPLEEVIGKLEYLTYVVRLTGFKGMFDDPNFWAQAAKQGIKRPRGQPPKIARFTVALEVLATLQTRGVRATKYRNGTLAQVLAFVLDAAGMPVPGEDVMFDVIRKAAARAKDDPDFGSR